MQLRLPPRELLVSYAQNFEDVLLHRVFPDLDNGFYVDIGAFDPVIGSVTKIFYDRGWSGINIEPSSVFERLLAGRPRDVNLNIAILDEQGEVSFVENTTDRAVSHVEFSIGAEQEEGETRTYSVACDRLDRVLAEHAAGRLINFMKIDAEGSEARILRSTDWTQIRPQILLIEAVAPWTNELISQTWESSLLSSGYKRAYFDGLNLFFVRDEDADLLRHFDRPVNALDWFAKYDPVKDRALADGVALFEVLKEMALQLEAVPRRHRGLSDETEAETETETETEVGEEHVTSSKPVILDPEQLLAEFRAALLCAARLDHIVDQLDQVLERRRDLVARAGRDTVRPDLDADVPVTLELTQLLQEVEAAVAAAMRCDHIVRQLEDPGGPRALRTVLLPARLLRKVWGLTTKKRGAVVHAPAHPSPAMGRLRAVLAMPRNLVYRMLARLVRPVAWRAREYLLAPLRPMAGQLDMIARDMEIIRRELASAEDLSPELARSIETLLLTVASSRQRQEPSRLDRAAR